TYSRLNSKPSDIVSLIGDPREYINETAQAVAFKTVLEYAMENDIDGITYVNEIEDPGSISYIAFSDDQVGIVDSDSGTNTLFQGYHPSRNMSNNAVSAYRGGERPLYKWTKNNLLAIAKVLIGEKVDGMNADDLKNSFLTRSSWHHTGVNYTKTDFYRFDLDKARKLLAGEIPTGWEFSFDDITGPHLSKKTDIVVKHMARNNISRIEAIEDISRALSEEYTPDMYGVVRINGTKISRHDIEKLGMVTDKLVDYYNFGNGDDTSWVSRLKDITFNAPWNKSELLMVIDPRELLEYGVLTVDEWEEYILFQDDQATEHHRELALESESWEAFKESFIIDVGMDFDAWIPEDDQWYIDTFNLAHGISPNDTLEAEPETLKTQMESEDQKDEYFEELVADDKELEKFISEMGIILTDTSLESGPVMDEEEAVERDRRVDLRVRIENEVTPFILANILRSTTSKKISPTAIKSIRTMMSGERTRFYRDLYAAVMKDKNLEAKVIDSRLPNIDEPGWNEIETLSINERIRLANDIEAEELKKLIMSGAELFDGQAEKVIAKMDRDIEKLEKQITTQEKELDARSEKMNKQERDLYLLYKKIAEARSKLAEENRKLRKKADADPKYQADLTGTYALENQISGLSDQINKLRASDRVKATVKRQESLAKLKEELTNKQKQKDDARKVRQHKIKLARRIQHKPSDAVDYEYRQMIYSIQSMLDPAFRRDVDEDMEIDVLEGNRTDEEIINNVGQRTYERIMGLRRPLNDWNLNDLESAAELVSDLITEGRQVWEAKEMQKKITASRYRTEIIKSVLSSTKMLTGDQRYVERPLTGSL
ncbi:MAG: hypothetical protein JXK93_11295, partial [Sphaerochaetaceae bacterium]|nr:hypothetical protein [Sphaerochaetaceae bacterium]